MSVIENKKIAFTQADLDAVSLVPDAVSLAPEVQKAMLAVQRAMKAHNGLLIGPNRNTRAIFKGGRVCVDCAIWKPWSAYYADNARAGGSGHMGRCIKCNQHDCWRRYYERL